MTFLCAACFPQNAKHRTYAKVGEGVALASGIALLYAVSSGADCDQMRKLGDPASSCRDGASIASGIGLGLILLGLGGFIATVSSSPDDDDAPAASAPLNAQPAAATDPPTHAPTRANLSPAGFVPKSFAP